MTRTTLPTTLLTTLTAAGAALGLAAVPAVAATPAPVTKAHVSVHRGGDPFGPDNSLVAFKGALAAGFVDIEGDARITRDGYVMIRHDDGLAACTGETSGQTISGSLRSQLSGVRCGGEPIPTLISVVDAFKASSNTAAKLRLEVKHAASRGDESEAAIIAQKIEEHGFVGRTIIEDFSWRITTDNIRGVNSGLRISCLDSDPVTTTMVDRADAEGCYDLSYQAGEGSEALVDRLHARGVKAAVWTVNEIDRAELSRGAGVDVIITDKPYAIMR